MTLAVRRWEQIAMSVGEMEFELAAGTLDEESLWPPWSVNGQVGHTGLSIRHIIRALALAV